MDEPLIRIGKHPGGAGSSGTDVNMGFSDFSIAQERLRFKTELEHLALIRRKNKEGD